MKINKVWLDWLSVVGLDWGIEIVTNPPNCTYYFEPFISVSEANSQLSGYLKDLKSEAAEGIRVSVKRCKPTQLTIEREPRPLADYYCHADSNNLYSISQLLTQLESIV